MLALVVCLAGCATRMGSSMTDAGDAGSFVIPTTAPAGSLLLSPRNTHITFIGSALLNSHEGAFTRFAGQLDYPPGSDLGDARLTVEIDMTSVVTEIPLLTRHLKEADFFDVAKYPRASFVSTRIRPSPAPGPSGTISGELTLHGRTRTISFPARFTAEPRGVALDATFTIRQSDFGMLSARTTTDDVPTRVWARLSR
jgi:polyisoprenoid-binding protein YceI